MTKPMDMGMTSVEQHVAMAPQSTVDGLAGADGQAIVGSWRLTVYEADGPPTYALATCCADGTLVTAEHPVVTPPGAPSVIFTSSGHGTWAATGPDTADLTFVVLGSDQQGNLFAVATFRVAITLNSGGQTLAGEFVVMLDDVSGNTMATFHGTVQGRRIVAEPLGVLVADTSTGDNHSL